MPTPPAPRWYALPLLVLGLLGFTAFWVLTALAFDIVAWESALHMGPWFAWQLARLANGPLQAGLYLLALALALGLGLSGRRPAPSAR